MDRGVCCPRLYHMLGYAHLFVSSNHIYVAVSDKLSTPVLIALRIYALWNKNVVLFLLVFLLNMTPVITNIVSTSTSSNAEIVHSCLLGVLYQMDAEYQHCSAHHLGMQRRIGAGAAQFPETVRITDQIGMISPTYNYEDVGLVCVRTFDALIKLYIVSVSCNENSSHLQRRSGSLVNMG